MKRVLLACLLVAAVAAAEPWAARRDSVTTLRRAGDTRAATQWLQDWLRSHPDDGDARLLLGELRLEAGDEKEAARIWSRAVADGAVGTDRVRDVSARLQVLGRDAEALEVLETARVRLGGEVDPFAWQRAELYLGLGRWADAAGAHRAFLRQEPRRRSMVQGRMSLIARRRGAASVRAYAAALEGALDEAAPGERDVLISLLASCALDAGEPRRGLEMLRAALARGASDDLVAGLFDFATRCEALGLDDIAAEAYALYAGRAGDSPYRAHSLLKQAQMSAGTGDARRALQLYRALAATEGPEARVAALEAARLQAGPLEDPAGALQTLAGLEGRAMSPELRRRLWAQRADCHLRLDDLDAAAAAWTHLAAQPEGRAEAELGLAQLAFYAGRFDSAAAAADTLVRREPAHPAANDALELLLLIDAHGDQPRALALLSAARLRSRQGRFAAADTLWQALAAAAPADLRHAGLLEQASGLEARAPSRALQLYEQVAADDPGERDAVSAALGRARLLEGMDRAEDALRAYEAALLAAPGDPRGPDMRRHIERLRALLGDTTG